MLEIWMVSTDGRSVHGRRAGEAAVYEWEEIHFCGRGAKKIGLLCLLRRKTENIFDGSRNNQKNCGKLKKARKSAFCFNVRLTKSANILVGKTVKATKV